jgi:magnesium transporter
MGIGDRAPSIYGMNFEHMPELEWQYGYALVLAVIASVCGWLYWRFRQNRWLSPIPIDETFLPSR